MKIAARGVIGMSAPAKELLDGIYRRKILQARSMTPEERVASEMQLSNLAMRVMKEGVRDQFPTATEEQISSIVRERIELLRYLKGKRRTTEPLNTSYD